MNRKIKKEVKDLITNHSENVSDNTLFATLILPSC